MGQFIYESTQETGDIILNANENNIELDPIIKKEIQESIANIPLNRYPENENYEICKAFANYLKVSVDEVCAGNGSDAMLCQVITNEINKDGVLYTIDPDFSMYDYYVSANQGKIIKYKTREDGSFSVEEFIKEGIKHKPNLIIFSNPNNPTSNILNNEEILEIVKAFPNIKVVIDEAYIDFSNCSVVKYINEYNNLLVTRTMSKAWGMAGIRVGFLIANSNYMLKFKAMKVPYNLNSISQVIGTIVLNHINIYERNVATLITEREQLLTELKKIKAIKVYPSNSNFIFGRSENKLKMIEGLKASGIVIRNYSENNSFRISVGTHEENVKIIEVLNSIFA
ncbi:MAG: histidinol-phosphate transaminase [Erysipelotrichaceae bacterium]